MEDRFISKIKHFIDLILHKKEWRRLVSVLACLVVFITTYALILPAITEENTSQIQTDGKSLENSIDSISFLKKQNSWDNYGEMYGTIAVGDYVKLTLNFDIEKGTIPDSGIMYYQLPVTLVEAVSERDLRNSTGDIIGSYYITQDGLLVFKFNSDVVENNKSVGLTGKANLEFQVASVSTDENGKIKFPYHSEIDDYVFEVITHEQETNRDKQVITIKKEQDVSESEGSIAYTIKIESQSGTSGNITVSDYMTNLSLTGVVTVKKYDSGNSLLNSSTGSSLNMNLDALEAGQYYLITYTAKIPDGTTATTYTKNSVTATTKNEYEKTITQRAEVEYTFYFPKISKKYTDFDGKNITWEITVTSNGKDLEGWKLEDILNKNNLDSEAKNIEITVNPAINGSSTVTLPYTFPAGSTGTYTFTYTTPSQTETAGAVTSTNEAILTSEDGDVSYDTGEVQGPKNSPMEKTGTVLGVYEQDPTRYKIQWTIVVRGPITGSWFLNDELWSQQGVPGDELLRLLEDLDSQISDLGLTYSFQAGELADDKDDIKQWVTNKDNISSSAMYKGINFNFVGNLDADKTINLTYYSVTPYNHDWNGKTYTNAVNFNNLVIEKAQVEVKPTLYKYDFYNDSSQNSSYSIKETESYQPTWKLRIVKPEGLTGDLIITENIPDYLSIDKLSMWQYENFSESELIINDTTVINSWDSNVGKIGIVTSLSGSTLTVTIPSSLVNKIATGKEIWLKIQTTIDEEAWPEYVDNKSSLIFANEATITNNGEVIGKDIQTQTITKEKPSETPVDDSKNVSKSFTFDNSHNILKYSVIINPDGKDLVQYSDVINVKDTLYFKNWVIQEGIDVSLVSSSFHVKEYLGNGITGNEINVQSSYRSYYDNVTDPYNLVQYHYLDLIVPDEKALLLEYEYKINGPADQQCLFYNQIILDGEGEAYKSDQVEANVKTQTVDAVFDYAGIVITKVDSMNLTKRLSNAKFKLYRYNSDEYAYIGDYSTNSSGQFTVVYPNVLEKNILYKLEEDTPPSGYSKNTEPVYFYVPEDSNSSPALPNGLNLSDVQKLVLGQQLYITNESKTTSISILKEWKDENGEKIEPENLTSLDFKLYQILSTSQDSISENAQKSEYGTYNVTSKSTPAWQTTIDGLPKTVTEEINNQEVTYYCFYQIEEQGVSGYSVEYKNNDGLTSGLIRMVNTQTDNTDYILPETGGIGSDKFIIIGSSIVLLSTLTLVYRALKKN